MRIHDLAGWPPSRFQTAEAPSKKFVPDNPRTLKLRNVSYFPGYRRAGTAGDLLLVLDCRESGEVCTARLKVKSVDVAWRAEVILTACRGLSLIQAGNRIIPGVD